MFSSWTQLMIFHFRSDSGLVCQKSYLGFFFYYYYLSYSCYISSRNFLPTHVLGLFSSLQPQSFKNIVVVLGRHLHCIRTSSWWSEFSEQLYKATGLTWQSLIKSKTGWFYLTKLKIKQEGRKEGNQTAKSNLYVTLVLK